MSEPVLPPHPNRFDQAEAAVGRLALERGLITEEQLERALRSQESTQTASLTLAQVLIQNRMLSSRQYLELQRELQALLLICRHCGKQAYLLHRPQDTSPLCLECGQQLSALAQGETTISRREGAWIGRYQILRRIAQGGMGAVYLAEDHDLRRQVAIKVLRSSETEDIDLIARLHREAQVVAGLSHPGIIAVHEVGVAPGEEFAAEQHYIIMEYIEGGTLRQAAPALWLEQKVALLEQVAEAVGYAHEQGVVHRDLKPDNVLLRTDGSAVVTDFGLARWIDGQTGLTRSGQTVGTLHYMAPEQVIGGRARIGPQTDVWALGVMLYELLTGARPFDDESPLRVYEEIRLGLPRPPRQIDPAIPRALETICLKALEKTRARRYADGAAFAKELRRWQEGEPIEARPPSLFDVLRQRVRRNPRSLALALLALLLVAAGLATSMWRKSERQIERSAGIAQATERAGRALAAWENQRYARPHDVSRWREELRAELPALERAVQAYPGAAEAWSLLGWIRYEMGAIEPAATALERAVAQDPRAALHHYRLGRVLISWIEREQRLALQEQHLPERLAREGRVERLTRRIVAAFRRAVELPAHEGLSLARRMFAQAYLLRIAGQVDESQRICRLMAEQHPLGGEEGLLLLGHLALRLEDKLRHYEAAIDRARSLLRSRVAAAYAHTFLAAERAAAGASREEVERGFRQAIAHATTGVTIDPGASAPWVARGTARVAWGAYLQRIGLSPAEHYAEAVKGDFLQASRLDPGDAESCLSGGRTAAALAQHLESTGRAREAAVWLAISHKCLSQAIELTGQHPPAARAWSQRARLHIARGDTARALADLEQAVRLDPSLRKALAPLFEQARQATRRR